MYVCAHVSRWLLLDFKREFPLEESVRIFEVLSSHYLELNSDKALVETDKVIAKEFELDGMLCMCALSLALPVCSLPSIASVLSPSVASVLSPSFASVLSP